jgi:hypothetical protein
MTGETGPAPKAAIWEDFLDIFYAPSQVFERRRDGNPLVPLFFLTLVLTALYFATAPLLQPVFDAEWSRNAERMMESKPEITADQMEQGRKIAETFGAVFVLIGIPIGALLIGLALWLVGKFFDSRQSVRSALVVSAFAFFPRILEMVVNGVQGLLLDPASLDSRFSLKLGVARFIDPDTTSPAVMALFERVDVFTIWVTVLLAIGLKVTGAVSGRAAAAAAAVVWLIGALPTVLGSLFSPG